MFKGNTDTDLIKISDNLVYLEILSKLTFHFVNLKCKTYPPVKVEMKLKKKYRFDNGRQIWRIIPGNSGILVVEERETEKKQVYFRCIDLDSGKKILENFQIDDNFWVGVETVHDDFIYFHKFAKPDMPKHRGIFAYNIVQQKFIWENPELVFLFLSERKLFAFKDKFEGKYYFTIDPLTGEIIEELGNQHEKINDLRNKSLVEESSKVNLFPEIFEIDSATDHKANQLLNSLRDNFIISGKIEFILRNELLLISFHTVNSKGTFNNLFKAVDLSTGKYILEETINKETRLYLSDSFFVKDDFLFLLFGKSRLVVYKIIY